MRRATLKQYLQIGAMLQDGAIDREMAQAIIGGRVGVIGKPLGENEYLIYVDYDMPRDREKLGVEFSRGGVSEPFYNQDWELHSSCLPDGKTGADADQTPGNRVMLLKHFGRKTRSEANIAEMDKLGYRPATHLELYAFAKANPELQRQFCIVALGSYTLCPGRHRVAVLYGNSDGRFLGSVWFEHEWDPGDRFLFVRK